MRVLVVDPGKVTGWGFLDWEHGAPESVTFWGGELPHDEFVDWSLSVIRGGILPEPFYRPDRVLCEGFSVTQRTVKEASDDRSLWSVKQIGVLETWCRWYGAEFLRCMPADKGFDRDGAKIKRLGWWDPLPGVRGERGHRRDAARHAVKYAVDNHVIDLRSLLPQ